MIAESAIDALSHVVLFPALCARYASIGGQMNPRHPALITAAALKMPEGSEVIAAMDNDQDGSKLAEEVRLAVTASGRGDLQFTVSIPERVKDWNDALRSRAHSFPTALPSAEV